MVSSLWSPSDDELKLPILIRVMNLDENVLKLSTFVDLHIIYRDQLWVLERCSRWYLLGCHGEASLSSETNGSAETVDETLKFEIEKAMLVLSCALGLHVKFAHCRSLPFSTLLTACCYSARLPDCQSLQSFQHKVSSRSDNRASSPVHNLALILPTRSLH